VPLRFNRERRLTTVCTRPAAFHPHAQTAPTFTYLSPDEPDGKLQGEAKPTSTTCHGANKRNIEESANEWPPFLF